LFWISSLFWLIICEEFLLLSITPTIWFKKVGGREKFEE
jgi:hypothetical protein